MKMKLLMGHCRDWTWVGKISANCYCTRMRRRGRMELLISICLLDVRVWSLCHWNLCTLFCICSNMTSLN